MPVELHFEEPSPFMMRAFGVAIVDEVRLAIEEVLADSRLCDGVAIFIDNRVIPAVLRLPCDGGLER
jgi:hypothetical protein